MLTRVGVGLLQAALLLLLVGLALGNYLMILAGSFPLFVFLAGVGFEPPGRVDARCTLSRRRMPAGEVLHVHVEVEARQGRGLLEVHCPLPEVFELVEGTNLHLYRKGRGTLRAQFDFAVRCTKRGAWTMGPVAYEGVPALGLQSGESGLAGEPVPFEVLPRLQALRRVRAPVGHATRLFPEADVSRTGVRTTDFREVRAYAWGDPPSAVNWKATARQAAQGRHAPPLVNEYEREGRKTVWIFVDASRRMEVGSTAENAFEHGIEAAASVAKFYLDRGFRVGCYAYNAGERLVHPDTGGKQFLRIQQALTALVPGEPAEGLRPAVERCKFFLATGRPLMVVVTRLAADTDDLAAGVAAMRPFVSRHRRRLPIVVVSPVAHYPTRGEEDLGSGELLRCLETPARARIRSLGATVVEWDPRRRPLAEALVRGMR